MRNLRFQSGQTLIETIVAIFVLVTALTTGLGLAIYAMNTARTSQDEIVASNLAREGVDVIRMMRDSNWLAGDAVGGAYALQTCPDLPAGKQLCYPLAFRGPTYNMDEDGGYSEKRYKVQLNPAGTAWQLQGSANSAVQVRLYRTPSGVFTHQTTGTTQTPFARQIHISFNTASPYTATNPEMIVRSSVAWEGKNCTPFPENNWNIHTWNSSCKVVVEEHLTNWKDYQ